MYINIVTRGSSEHCALRSTGANLRDRICSPGASSQAEELLRRPPTLAELCKILNPRSDFGRPGGNQPSVVRYRTQLPSVRVPAYHVTSRRACCGHAIFGDPPRLASTPVARAACLVLGATTVLQEQSFQTVSDISMHGVA